MAQTNSADLCSSMGISSEDYDRQCALEMEGFRLGCERYMARVEKIKGSASDNTQLKPEAAIVNQYTSLLAPLIQLATRATAGGSKDVRRARQVIASLPALRVAFLTLRHALNIEQAHNGITDLCIKLGYQIEKDSEYQTFQQLAPGYLSKVERQMGSQHALNRHKTLTRAQELVEIRGENGEVLSTGIPKLNLDQQVRFHVGKILLEILTEQTPLLAMGSKPCRRRAGKGKGTVASMTGTLEPTETLLNLLADSHNMLAEASPIVYPCVIPPKPWEGTHGGGFWTQYKSLRSKILRTRNKQALKRAGAQGLDKVCAALNAIQATPYRINKRVLDVMALSALEGIGGLPAPDTDRVMIDGTTPLAERSPWGSSEMTSMRADGDPRLKGWLDRKSKAWDQWYHSQSKRQSLLWKLRIARKFADEPSLYFVWNMDYRGRVYCMQPYINPQQDDSGKALIEFAQGKPLGKSGARWLMIHGANEFGFDKAKLFERVQWCKDHHESLLDSAANPMDGERFWAEAEHPFNFLAFCFEYAGYCAQGESFISHIRVHVDGTCSGLQHYSALLRDYRGGLSTNLVPQGHKADVYGEVATEVNTMLNRDATGGTDQRTYAEGWLAVGVDRKTVKRNVMTFCYGATRPGFIQQLIDDTAITPEGVDKYKACQYLGAKDWEAVSLILEKSVEAMRYLQKIAHFTASLSLDIQWVTPIGLLVTQDYLKTASTQINTWWGQARIQPRISSETAVKDAGGARNGIAPNFIHSMDASHLMLTTLACKADGIDAFSYIHDSFGTHASDMDKMSRILRETFIKMYSEPILDQWTEGVRAQVPAENLKDFDDIVAEFLPSMGSLDLNTVQESTYFFS